MRSFISTGVLSIPAESGGRTNSVGDVLNGVSYSPGYSVCSWAMLKVRDFHPQL